MATTVFDMPLDNQVYAIEDGMAIVSIGDMHDAITSGQYVFIRDHDTLTTGLYISTAAIASNVALTSSNVTAVSSGGLNDLKSKIPSFPLSVANGGSGLSASPSMLTNLGSTTAANIMAANPRPGVTGTLPIANGGTGSTTAANARTALGVPNIRTTYLELNYSIAAGANSKHNLKTEIDAVKPSGSTVLGIVGITTNNGVVFPFSFQYRNSEYALELHNAGDVTATNKVRIYYLYY